MFFQFLINGLSLASIYAMLAIGYNMVYGILGQLNFAHGDVYAVGCFVVFSLLSSGVHPVVAIVGGIATGFVLNLVVERFAYRKLRGVANRIAPTISAVGIAYIMRNLIMKIWGSGTYSFDLKIVKPEYYQVGDTVIGTLQIGIMIIAIALVIIITLALKYTRWGQAIICISQNISAASLMGIPVNKVIALVYGLGAALGVIGGLMFCTYFQYISYTIGFTYGTMKAWMCAIWGGIGSLSGSVIGALALGLAESFVSGFVSSAYKDAIVWLIFIVFIFIKPNGLFPAQSKEKV